MIEGPLGGAAFNNEFGRPDLGGFFRVYEQTVDGVRRGYPQADHDRRRPGHASAPTMTHKIVFPAGTLLVQLGGPGMRIGMGGGAASSMAAGANAAELDFDSVQRGNPEIERRAQEVINHCWSLGDGQPGPGDPRRRRRRPVERLPRARRRRRPRRALRPAAGAARGVGPGAEGDLVQREPGALRAGDRAGVAGAVRARSASASAARTRWSASPRDERPAGARRRPRRPRRRATAPSTCRWTCCSASRPRCTRDVQPRARATCAPLDLDRRRPAARPRIDVLRHPTVASKRFLDHHRRPHGRRPDAPRPDGRPVAGAGGRLRGDAGRLRRLRRRGDGHGRAHAAGRPRRAGVRPDGGRRGHHQPAGRADRAARVKLSLQLDGRLRRAAARTRALRHRARPSAWSCARRSGISVPVGKDSLSMRTRWTRRAGEAQQVTSPVSA